MHTEQQHTETTGAQPWRDTAEQATRDTAYYRGLLDQIAAHLGPEAFQSDDGSVHDEPVRAKLPELVKALVKALVA